MQLFGGKALSQLTFDELRLELTTNEVAEGFFVDYKEAFPEKLYKYVASFANSHGGYVFIGIKEHSQKKIADAFDGVLLDSDLSERARNIIHAHISPFPPVEITTIPLLSGTERRGIVVIKVPESPVAPHVCSDGVVYVRNGDSSEPAKDRFTLDRLYEKSRRMGDVLTERLSRTITFGRIYREKKWDDPILSTIRVLSALIYPASFASWEFLPFEKPQLQSAAMDLMGSANFRSLRNGIASVSGADSKYTSPEWWQARELGIAYEDGLVEHIYRQNRASDKVDIKGFVAVILSNAFDHAKRLEHRHVCVDPIVVEIHLLGIYGIRIAIDPDSSCPTASCQCDHGIVTYRFEITPLMRKSDEEWQETYYPALTKKIINALLADAGGRDRDF